ncbi:MAG TPA: FAD-dependent oxidoreductase [Devosiaceae bacterium]|nr:FAD-dependent oxidoreductase [Devosiaceae bacterium]
MGRVIILGGGYAGLHAFAGLRARLGRQMDDGEIEVTLISRDPYHTYHGWTGEVLSGRLAVERTLTPIAPMLHEHFLQAEVSGVDLVGRVVRVRTAEGENRVLAFDQLLFATGSKDPFDRLPGLAEHGWCVKDSRDMQKLVGRLEALETQPAAVCSVAIIGGGMAGVETASALALRFRERGVTQIAVHLVASGDCLLGGLRPDFTSIAQHATAVLEGQGIQVHYGRRVARIAEERIVFADGTSLLSDLTVAAAGIVFDGLPGADALPRSQTGQLRVDSNLQVFGQPGIWAAGDIAAVRHPATGEPCPTNALWAMKQGDCVGRNMARAIEGKPARGFGFKGLGQAAGLAGGGGISELFRLQFTGRPAWLLRILFFAWFMPSRAKGFGIVRDLLAQWAASALLRRPVPARPISAQIGNLASGSLSLERVTRP